MSNSKNHGNSPTDAVSRLQRLRRPRIMLSTDFGTSVPTDSACEPKTRPLRRLQKRVFQTKTSQSLTESFERAWLQLGASESVPVDVLTTHQSRIRETWPSSHFPNTLPAKRLCRMAGFL